jgi:hypothetical protein
VGNDGQQQFFTRNSDIDHWSNGVWNQVFLSDNSAPATSWGSGSNQYTNVPTTPVSQEEPFLYTNSAGRERIFIPAVRHNSIGPAYSGGSEAGRSLSISRFFVASPSSTVGAINAALHRGKDLILTPGVYHLKHTIQVAHPGTVVQGLGFPILIPTRGNEAMRTASVPGIKLGGIIFDAGSGAPRRGCRSPAARGPRVLVAGSMPSSASAPAAPATGASRRCCRISSSASGEPRPERPRTAWSSTPTTRSWTTCGDVTSYP